MTKEKIDLEKEAHKFFDKVCRGGVTLHGEYDRRHTKRCLELSEWAKSIAERVEEQTIQRCAYTKDGINRRVLNIERFYAQQSEPEESEKSKCYHKQDHSCICKCHMERMK